MEDLSKEKEEFLRVVKKYKLDEEEKAQEIANYLTKKEKINLVEFATDFNISQEDAKVFLEFVKKGIDFKESYLDKK